MFKKSKLNITVLIIFCLVFMFPDKILAAHVMTGNANGNFTYHQPNQESITSVYGSFALQRSNPDTWALISQYKAVRLIKVVITAYSSTPDQTDSTPFITAWGTHVRDGVVAANFLEFNAKITIPQIFGDKIFTVEDRMHTRFSDRVDIWFPTRSEAKEFGVKYTEIVILY